MAWKRGLGTEQSLRDIISAIGSGGGNVLVSREFFHGSKIGNRVQAFRRSPDAVPRLPCPRAPSQLGQRALRHAVHNEIGLGIEE